MSGAPDTYANDSPDVSKIEDYFLQLDASRNGLDKAVIPNNQPNDKLGLGLIRDVPEVKFCKVVHVGAHDKREKTIAADGAEGYEKNFACGPDGFEQDVGSSARRYFHGSSKTKPTARCVAITIGTRTRCWHDESRSSQHRIDVHFDLSTHRAEKI